MDSSRERGAGSEGEGGSPIPPVTNKADRTMDSTLERELSELKGKLEAAAKSAKSAFSELKKAKVSAKVGQMRR